MLLIEVLDLQVDQRTLPVEVAADRRPEARIVVCRIQSERDADGIDAAALRSVFVAPIGTHCSSEALRFRHIASFNGAPCPVMVSESAQG